MAETNKSTETTPTAADKYVKFVLPTPEWDESKAEDERGAKVSVFLRLIDYPGVGVFRHWIGEGNVKRPYNCPGKNAGCPACIARAVEKVKGNEDYKSLHRMDHRTVVNAIELKEGEEPKVKVFQINPSIQKRLDATISRGPKYADPTSYDIEVMKRKTGPAVFDIEYDVFLVDGGSRPLTATEKALLEKKYDLNLEKTPATVDEIGAAIKGVKGGTGLASQEQKEEVQKVLKAQGLTLLDVEIPDIDTMTAEKAAKTIKELG